MKKSKRIIIGSYILLSIAAIVLGLSFGSVLMAFFLMIIITALLVRTLKALNSQQLEPASDVQPEDQGGYPKYTLEYIKTCDNDKMKADGFSVWHDVSEHQYRLTVRLEDTRYWFLSVFIREDGSFNVFSLDYEDANDAHYEFVDEDEVRKNIYKDGDEKLYLHDVFRRYIAETSGYTLLSQIPVTASFHY